MKKSSFILGILFGLFAIFIVFGLFVSAKTSSEAENIPKDPSLQIKDKFSSEISESVHDYVLNFVEKRDISPSEISFVKEVDFNALPKEVNIQNVGDSNLAIYEVSYSEKGKEDKIYVITHSVDKLRSQGDLIVAQDKRQFLNFGFNGKTFNSGFLKTSNEITTSLDKGYVMVRDGSITAVSTNLEVFENGLGSLEILVYVNGERVGFGNILSTENSGIKRDYDVQSSGIVNFKAGDVISVYLRASNDALLNGISWGDVITLVEITTRT